MTVQTKEMKMLMPYGDSEGLAPYIQFYDHYRPHPTQCYKQTYFLSDSEVLAIVPNANDA